MSGPPPEVLERMDKPPPFVRGNANRYGTNNAIVPGSSAFEQNILEPPNMTPQELRNVDPNARGGRFAKNDGQPKSRKKKKKKRRKKKGKSGATAFYKRGDNANYDKEFLEMLDNHPDTRHSQGYNGMDAVPPPTRNSTFSFRNALPSFWFNSKKEQPEGRDNRLDSKGNIRDLEKHMLKPAIKIDLRTENFLRENEEDLIRRRNCVAFGLLCACYLIIASLIVSGIYFNETNTARSVVLTGPTFAPTTMFPTESPTNFPTDVPSKSPTRFPTVFPTKEPTKFPTRSPTTMEPTRAPTNYPTQFPTTMQPTRAPTNYPTQFPTDTPFPTASPTAYPTLFPTNSPTKFPTGFPTNSPTPFPTSD